MKRRTFIGTAAAAGIAVCIGARQSAVADKAALEKSKIALEKSDVILFQGDSITDAGRNKKDAIANAGLGRGYASHIATALRADYPDLDLQIQNRGISGNKVPDLDKRWDRDCIALKPKVLSILIGVNDIWHMLNGRYDGTAEVYRDGFTALLQRTREALPSTILVICEPFVLMSGTVKQNEDKWFPDVDKRQEYAKEVASSVGAIWVPFQTMFDEAVAAGTDPAALAADGVHPTPKGHRLMAETWRETVGI